MKHDTTILFITNYSRESQGGGIRVFVENLFDKLKERGCKLFLVARYGRSKGKNERIIKGNTITFIFHATLNCLKTRPTIIHSHANWYCIVPAILYRLIKKVKVVHTIHSIPEKNYNRRTKLLFNWLLQRCDHVHFVSVFLRGYYKDILQMDFKKSCIIYPGSDHGPRIVTIIEKEQFLSAFSIKKDAFIIVAQGLTAHLLKYHGAILLLEVFSGLLPEFPDLQLIFTKDGKYIDLLKQKADQLNISRSVTFTRDLENPAVANAVASIYAHITLAEGGISLAVLEAMAAANPIVATKAGGIPELLSDGVTALLVNAEVESVYTAMKELIVNSRLREFLGLRAKNHVDKQFTWNNTANDFMSLYNTLK